MNRRAFLSMLGGLALNEAIPLGRVWSFPKKIVLYAPLPPRPLDFDQTADYMDVIGTRYRAHDDFREWLLYGTQRWNFQNLVESK